MIKKFHFLSGICLFLVSGASAQIITLTSANMPDQSTVIVNNYVDNSYSDTMSIGPSGANQHWDFSHVLAVDYPDQTFYEAPDQTPHPAAFPGANLASTYELSDTADYTFFDLNANSFSQFGVFGTSEQLAFSPASKIFDFPCTYQSSLNQTCTVSGSIEDQQVGGQYKVQMNVDGYGTVKTVLGTFNCLRVKRITELSLSIFIFNIVQRDTFYEFWTSSFKAPVFSYDRYSSNYLGQVETGVDANVLVAQTTPTVEPVQTLTSDIQISPNPLNDHADLAMQLKSAGNVQITVADMNGKLVYQQNLGFLNPGTYDNTLESKNWPAGVYMAMIRQNGKVLGFKKLVKE